MINKLIYISFQPLTKKVEDDFYIRYSLEQGFEVEFWDISKIYFPLISFSEYQSEYVVHFTTFLDLEVKISDQSWKYNLFIPIIAIEYRFLKLFRLLTKYKCQTAFFARGAIPYPVNKKKSIFNVIGKIFNPISLSEYFKHKYVSILKRNDFVKFFDIVFCAGELGFQTIGNSYQIEKSNSKIININSFDFDQFVSTFHSTKNINHKYCLFLDEYLPYHPDFTLLKIKTIDPSEYYNKLNEFFRKVENKYNFKVIIAAHPKSEKYKTENPFDGRDIYFNRTAELAKFAEFTIAHCSTSISFPVLNNKPIIFLYNNSIKSLMPNYFRFILNFSNTLGGKIINMDNFSMNEIEIYNIDNEKYENYKYKYLTSIESEEKISKIIFIEVISSL